MQRIIDQCDELLERFEEGPIGQRWHTPVRQDFVDLVRIVRKLAATIDRDQTEID